MGCRANRAKGGTTSSRRPQFTTSTTSRHSLRAIVADPRVQRRNEQNLTRGRWVIDDAIIGWNVEEPARWLLATDVSQAIRGFAKSWIAVMAHNDYAQVLRKPAFVHAFDRPLVAKRPCRNCNRRSCAFSRDAFDCLSSE